MAQGNTVAISVRIARTTNSSISVKPAAWRWRRGRCLPVAEVRGICLASLAAIRSVGEDVVLPMLSRGSVVIGLAPGIGQTFALLDVGSIPAGRVGGPID